MSHRLPEYVADRWYNGVSDVWPGARRSVDMIMSPTLGDPNAENLGWLCVAVAYLAWRGDEVARGLVGLPATAIGDDELHHVMQMAPLAMRDGGLQVTDVPLWLAWPRSRCVYQFDADMAEAICDATATGEIETGDFARALPSSCFFIEAPGIEVRRGHVNVPMAGAFVTKTTMRDSRGEFKPHLIVSILGRDARIHDYHSLDLSLPTLGAMVDDLVSWGGGAVQSLYSDKGEFLGSRPNPEGSGPTEETARRTIYRIMSLVAYLCSYDPDVRRVGPTPAPSKRHARAGGLGSTPVVRVGDSFGAAIREWRASAASDGTGASVRPHLRRAHWSHYWVGALDSPERHRELRWIHELVVNGGEPEVTTVHRVR